MSEKEKGENVLRKILRFMYKHSLDGIILVGFALIFLGTLGVYIYGVFFWKTPPAGGDLLTLLATLLAILGLGGTAIYLWIYRRVDEAIKKDWQKERDLSKSEMARTLGISYLELYENVYGGDTYSKDGLKDSKGLGQIENSLHFFREAVDYIREIDEQELGNKHILRDLLINENNVVHCLARKWRYYRDGKTIIQFKRFLEKGVNKKLAKDYIADKICAENYLSDIFKPENLRNFPDIVERLKGTERMAKEAFAVEPEITSS
ncbi:MAG: hypothetical protein M1378_13475 [Bacteroidetes bacterium]|nr:hypothetical protein [Bacteroidota bacterium]